MTVVVSDGGVNLHPYSADDDDAAVAEDSFEWSLTECMERIAKRRQGDIVPSIFILCYPVESYRLNSHTDRIIIQDNVQDNGQDDGQDDVTLSAGARRGCD